MRAPRIPADAREESIGTTTRSRSGPAEARTTGGGVAAASPRALGVWDLAGGALYRGSAQPWARHRVKAGDWSRRRTRASRVTTDVSPWFGRGLECLARECDSRAAGSGLRRSFEDIHPVRTTHWRAWSRLFTVSESGTVVCNYVHVESAIVSRIIVPAGIGATASSLDAARGP
jgi:hypothetical protein